jgi:hypothetical protein
LIVSIAPVCIAALSCLWSIAACGQEAPRGAKAKVHRYSNLRSGALKTDKGWKAEDFAIAMFNPNPHPITVTWKLISDDPKFVFQDKRVGLWTKTFHLGPMGNQTYNVYAYEPSKFPVPPGSHFTGSTEVSAASPFYFYLLPMTKAVEAADAKKAVFEAWWAWDDRVPAVWDADLKQFVIPYTNYWHKHKIWKQGWHSRLVIANGSGRPVKYVIKHYPPDGTVEKSLGSHEKLETWLEDLYGWPKEVEIGVEGYLLIAPVPIEARKETTLTLHILPNDK